MFEQTFVDGTVKTKNKYTIFLSFLIQIAVIIVLILIPLIYTQALPSAQLRSMLVAPPPPPPPPPPKPVRPVVKQFVPKGFIAPKVIPKSIPQQVTEAPAPDISTGGNTGPAEGVPSLFAGPPGPPPPPAPKHTGPVRVGGNVAEANLIKKVQPQYPPLAKSARVQGTVEFTAVISKEGKIENLKLVRGHPLLVNAAKEAVLQWRYKPTMLNGEPVEVVTDIIVNFTLSS